MGKEIQVIRQVAGSKVGSAQIPMLQVSTAVVRRGLHGIWDVDQQERYLVVSIGAKKQDLGRYAP
jgi:hypothetical protein